MSPAARCSRERSSGLETVQPLRWSNRQRCNFSEAVPRGVDFAGADFRGADLSRAALTGAVFGNAVFSSGVFACAVFRARTRASRLDDGAHDPVREPPSYQGLPFTFPHLDGQLEH